MVDGSGPDGPRTTSPSFITNETRSVAVMSCSGSSTRATMSARAPGAITPSVPSWPSMAAAVTVPERKACQGVMPSAT